MQEEWLRRREELGPGSGCVQRGHWGAALGCPGTAQHEELRVEVEDTGRSLLCQDLHLLLVR